MAVKKKLEGLSVATQKTGDPLEVSQSTLKNWRRCHALYDYRYVQLIRRKKPVLQLIRGTMIGQCLDLLAQRRSNPKAPKWEAALAPFQAKYDKLFTAEKEYYGDPINEVRAIISKYEVLYANDGLNYAKVKGGDAAGGVAEYPIRVDLAPGIVFTGHIDKMPVDKQGRVWDMDHKSHKKIPQPEDRFSDLQQVLYQWAMPLSGYPKPAGVIWDYLRTKAPTVPEELKKGGLSQRQDIDTTWEVYEGEIKRLKLNPKDYKKMEGILKPRGLTDFYQRVPLPTPGAKMVENVVADAKATAIDVKQRGGADKTRSIDYTCRSCEFYNLCQTEFRGIDSSFIRKSEYEKNPEPRHIHQLEDEGE